MILVIENSFSGHSLSTWQYLAVRYAEKTETPRTANCIDIADKGKPRKQKETDVAKVVPIGFVRESSLFPSLSFLRKIASG